MRYVDCRAFARSWPGAAHLRRRKRTRESFSPPGWMQRLNGLVLKCSNAVVQHRHRIGNLRASGANFGAALYFGREMPGSVPVAHKRRQLVATMDLESLEWAVAVRPLAIPSYVQPFRSRRQNSYSRCVSGSSGDRHASSLEAPDRDQCACCFRMTALLSR